MFRSTTWNHLAPTSLAGYRVTADVRDVSGHAVISQTSLYVGTSTARLARPIDQLAAHVSRRHAAPTVADPDETAAGNTVAGRGVRLQFRGVSNVLLGTTVSTVARQF